MKKLFLAIVVLGSLAVASCTKHACPAYGSIQKTQVVSPSEKA